MESSVFPTTSSAVCSLNDEFYSVEQLSTLVQQAGKDGGNAGNIVATQLLSPILSRRPATDASASQTDANCFHLHTYTIDITLEAPLPTIEYHRREPQPNPRYEKYMTLRDKLVSSVPAMEVLEIIPMQYGIWRLNDPKRMFFAGYHVRKGKISPIHAFGGMHFPRKEHAGVLPMVFLDKSHLHIPGSNEWMPNSNALELQGWVQAILALDPTEKPTRKGNFRDKERVFTMKTSIGACWVPKEQPEETQVTKSKKKKNNKVKKDETTDPKQDPDIRLIITNHVYVDFEKLIEPHSDLANDLHGLILHSLLPAPVGTTYRTEVEARAGALKRFYECMQPAPPLPRMTSPSMFQPKEMVSKLHPFQIRTLALLLQREQAEIMKAYPLAVQHPRWWTNFDLGSAGKIAYQRETGKIVMLANVKQEKPNRKGKGRAMDIDVDDDGFTTEERDLLPPLVDLTDVRGTMLCEEMGLGKTLEAIALSLLHPHPLSTPRIMSTPAIDEPKAAGPSRKKKNEIPTIDIHRGVSDIDDPVVRSWIEQEEKAFKDKRVYDEQSQIHVSEVATTLIVTPPSLLKQWVTEIHTHAPGLRVCVYNGWKSLAASVQKQKVVNLRAAQKAAASNPKKRPTPSLRDKTVKKYTKARNGSRVKVEELSDSELSDEEEENDGVPGDENSFVEIVQKQFVAYVRGYDIVITTYGDLGQDLKVANPVPPRSRRATANYKLNDRPRSPLIMIEWWRVIMDEVQLSADQSDASNMVALIPRKNSLAMSGTPARSDIKDLIGSLRFLRIPTIPHDGRLWHRLQQTPMREAFEGLFRQIAVRTTKKEVTDELNIPRQTRMVIPIDLSQIELHYYNDTLERQKELLRRGGGGLDRALLRSCLLELRQICTHLQVGQMQERRGGQRLQLGSKIMTMTEALQKMRDDHQQEILVNSRLQARAMIRKAQLKMEEEDQETRFRVASAIYASVRQRMEQQLAPVQAELLDLLGDDDSVEDLEDATPDRTLTQQEKERTLAILRLKQSIREMLILIHQTWFFEGDVKHQTHDEEEETACYGRAEEMRKEILKGPLRYATKSIGELERSLERSTPIERVEDLQTKYTDHRAGILTRESCQQMDDLFKILNDNALLVHNWRQKIIELLTTPVEAEKPLEDPAVKSEEPEPGQNKEPEEDFYASAMKAQGDVEAYLAAYAAAVADRKEMMLEDKSYLATTESRIPNKRNTRAAKDAGVILDDRNRDVEDLRETLMLERQVFRDARKEQGCERPLKAIVLDLNKINLGQHRQEEKDIAKGLMDVIKSYMGDQAELVEKLNKELEKFRAIFNKRVKYFAALQEISDSVSHPVYKDRAKELADCDQQINSLETKLARMTVKGRYLTYLASRGSDDQELRDDCIICMGSSDDTAAVILECGHFFCNSCFSEFRKSQQRDTCPHCRSRINTADVTRVALKTSSAAGPESATLTMLNVDSNGEEVPADETEDAEGSAQTAAAKERETAERAEALARLRRMPMVTQREIQREDHVGDWGSKVNFLIKHLLHYRTTDPNARHVIFSNWSDSLKIVMRALQSNGISYVSFDQGKSKDVVDRFLAKESISVFLLHAERESSGLTLTACKIVHLLEPVLQHSFELQAIGRVDRLGQERETTVFCYATEETVESRILARGVRTGTSIYLADQTSDEAVANMPNVVSAAHKGGDLSGGNEEELLSLIL